MKKILLLIGFVFLSYQGFSYEIMDSSQGIIKTTKARDIKIDSFSSIQNLENWLRNYPNYLIHQIIVKDTEYIVIYSKN